MRELDMILQMEINQTIRDDLVGHMGQAMMLPTMIAHLSATFLSHHILNPRYLTA